MASRRWRHERSLRGRRLAEAGICALLLLLPGVSPAAVAPATALGKLQAWLDATRDLQGRFVQQLESGALGTDLEERGRFYIERPGKMRWDYLEPEHKTAIVSGESTWLYVEEERQLILGRLDEQDDLLTGLLAGAARLDELFRPGAAPEGEARRESLYRLRLEPEASSDALRWLILDLAPPEYSIVGAEVMDSAGNHMRYAFQRIRRNRGLPGEMFRFEPPAGTHVAGGH